MGCASSKPSTTDNTPTTKNSKKLKDDKTNAKSSKKSSQKSHSASPEKSTKPTDVTISNDQSSSSNDLVKLDAPLLDQIKSNEDLVISYIVKRVLKDLNNELINGNSTSKSNGTTPSASNNSGTFASVALAAVAASDNEDLIIDVATKAVNLVKHPDNQANLTYKSLNHSLKSSPFLCKNQTHKSRICDLTVDTVKECLTNLSNSQVKNLTDYLTSSPDFKFIKDEKSKQQQQNQQQQQPQPESLIHPVLMSRTEANELARMLFLSNRGRPIVHASSGVKDAYYVNKFLDDTNAEVTVTQEEIDDILNKNLTSTIINPPAFTLLESPTKTSINEETSSSPTKKEEACEFTWSSLVNGESSDKQHEESTQLLSSTLLSTPPESSTTENDVVKAINNESDNLVENNTPQTVSDLNENLNNLNKVELVNNEIITNIKSDQQETDETSNQQEQVEQHKLEIVETQLILQKLTQNTNVSVESNSTNLNQEIEHNNSNNNNLNEPVPLVEATNVNVVEESKIETSTNLNEVESTTTITSKTTTTTSSTPESVAEVIETKLNIETEPVVETKSQEVNVEVIKQEVYEPVVAPVAELIESIVTQNSEKPVEQQQNTDNQIQDVTTDNNTTPNKVEIQPEELTPKEIELSKEEVVEIEQGNEQNTKHVVESVEIPVVEPTTQIEDQATLVIGSDEITTEKSPITNEPTESTQPVVNNSDLNQVELNLNDNNNNDKNNNINNNDSKNGEDSNLASDNNTNSNTLNETKDNGELDPILKQSLLDDRFYNNDSFKTEPPVNGDHLNEAATKIQAALRAENIRDELKDEIQVNQISWLNNSSEVILTAETLLRLVETVDSNLLLLDSTSNLNQTTNTTHKKSDDLNESLSKNDDDEEEEESEEIHLNEEDYLINSQIDQLFNHLSMDSDKNKNEDILKKKETITSNTTSSDSTDESKCQKVDLNKAAIKIQSTFRGYKTRKNLNNQFKIVNQEKKSKKRSNSESDSIKKQETNNNENNISNNDNNNNKNTSNEADSITSTSNKKAHIVISDPQQAAIKIQSTFRGYKTRKLLRTNKINKSVDSSQSDDQQTTTSKNDNGSDSEKTPEKSTTPDLPTDTSIDLNETTKNTTPNNTTSNKNNNNSSGKNKNKKKNRK